MKSFKQFNENIRNILKGKSDEEMYNTLKDLSDNEKVKYIIRYQLNFDLLPRNEDGICVYNRYLDCRNNKLTKLPDNLTINSGLDCSNNQLTKLPSNLIVHGTLNCTYNQLTQIPEGIVVEGYLYCANNKVLLERPMFAIIGEFIN